MDIRYQGRKMDNSGGYPGIEMDFSGGYQGI